MKWLKRFRPTEAQRGERNALQYMATDPTEDSINRNWSAACEDEGFGDPEYAKAWKAVVRPYWEALRPKNKPIPAVSSGASWTNLEDQKLAALMTNVIGEMEGRSASAVMSRIEHLRERNFGYWPIPRHDQ